jgi:nucleotide-binding universal stress UspA family protein
MGTHGRGSLDRFVLGSTTEGVLRHSSGPALTVGPNVDKRLASYRITG